MMKKISTSFAFQAQSKFVENKQKKKVLFNLLSTILSFDENPLCVTYTRKLLKIKDYFIMYSVYFLYD